MSYESKGYPAGYLARRRHEHNQSRKGIGYKPPQFLTALTQWDMAKLDVKPQTYAVMKQPTIINRVMDKGVAFCRRILGR